MGYEYGDGFENKKGVIVYEGDKIRDPLDDGAIREIASIAPYDDEEATLYMVDGGVMGASEITWDMFA